MGEQGYGWPWRTAEVPQDTVWMGNKMAGEILVDKY